MKIRVFVQFYLSWLPFENLSVISSGILLNADITYNLQFNGEIIEDLSKGNRFLAIVLRFFCPRDRLRRSPRYICPLLHGPVKYYTLHDNGVQKLTS